MHACKRTNGRMDGNMTILGMQVGSKALTGGRKSRNPRLGVGPAATAATASTDTVGQIL